MADPRNITICTMVNKYLVLLAKISLIRPTFWFIHDRGMGFLHLTDLTIIIASISVTHSLDH